MFKWEFIKLGTGGVLKITQSVILLPFLSFLSGKGRERPVESLRRIYFMVELAFTQRLSQELLDRRNNASEVEVN
jgi:hypothetical protein